MIMSVWCGWEDGAKRDRATQHHGEVPTHGESRAERGKKTWHMDGSFSLTICFRRKEKENRRTPVVTITFCVLSNVSVFAW